MQTVKLLLTATILTIIPSQLIRLQLTETSAINLTDILTLITVLVFGIFSLITKKKPKLPKEFTFSTSLFLLSALISSAISLYYFKLNEVVIGSLFLIRLTGYLLLPFVIVNTISKKQIKNYVKLILLSATIFTLLGYIQLIIFPNLTQLEKYGWDPHINRLVSTTLDPNYTGMMLTIFASLSICLYLYENKKVGALLSFLFSLAIVLTFSRSTYIAYTLMMLTVAALKAPKIIIFLLITFILAFLILPSSRQRVVGALNVDKTSRSRIESWQNAFMIIKNHPIFGIGFNNYRYAQSAYGFFDYDQTGGHSGAGVDSSILLTLATTGAVGTLMYLNLLKSFAKIALKNLKKNYLSLTIISSLVALVIHSQFVNSFYFPQIILILMVLLGLKYAQDS